MTILDKLNEGTPDHIKRLCRCFQNSLRTTAAYSSRTLKVYCDISECAHILPPAYPTFDSVHINDLQRHCKSIAFPVRNRSVAYTRSNPIAFSEYSASHNWDSGLVVLVVSPS